MDKRAILPGWEQVIVLFLYRLARRVRNVYPLYVLTRIINIAVVQFLLGGIIFPHAEIGEGLRLPHGAMGIVIHADCKIGNNVTIFHQVTIGVREGSGSWGAPVIEDGVTIGVGAKILGPITIGRGATIGANAVVIRDVPAGWTAVGVPAKNIPPS